MTVSQPEGRAQCERCRRPQAVCYCAHLPQLETRTRVLILQHPRERTTAIGTARMAHLALPGSTLRVGVSFADDPVVRAALAERPAYLLFPGPTAIEPSALPHDPPITLVVVDGTWWQAQKLVRANPMLAALPRVSFSPSRASEYAIRRQPAEFCVSTIEALAEVLGVLEHKTLPGEGFDALRVPFRAMVAMQQRYQSEVGSSRHQKPSKPRPSRRERLTTKIAEAWPHLLCVQGDANGWARNDPRREPSEMILWTAYRPATGERFSHLVAPRRPLAPATPAHTGVSMEALAAGSSIEACRAAWLEFVRPDDELVCWGRFYSDLAEAEGLSLPPGRLDLRVAAGELLRDHIATVEDFVARLGAPAVAPADATRAAQRLAGLIAAVTALRAG